jgi:hypothetical protein
MHVLSTQCLPPLQFAPQVVKGAVSLLPKSSRYMIAISIHATAT